MASVSLYCFSLTLGPLDLIESGYAFRSREREPPYFFSPFALCASCVRPRLGYSTLTSSGLALTGSFGTLGKSAAAIDSSSTATGSSKASITLSNCTFF